VKQIYEVSFVDDLQSVVTSPWLYATLEYSQQKAFITHDTN